MVQLRCYPCYYKLSYDGQCKKHDKVCLLNNYLTFLDVGYFGIFGFFYVHSKYYTRYCNKHYVTSCQQHFIVHQSKDRYGFFVTFPCTPSCKRRLCPTYTDFNAN